MIRLRGHHLLCLLGYRGLGYSPAFVERMTQVYEALRRMPQRPVRVVFGPDDLCAAFPAQGDSHCLEERVLARDERVRTRLGLRVGAQLPFAEVLARVRTGVLPDDIARWCATCPWQPLGLCAEGVARVREGRGLPPLPGDGG
jgi:hypothetical protein